MDLKKYRGYFSQKALREKLEKTGKKGLFKLRYNALLLLEIMKSPDVPIKSKAMIAGALGYLILPMDIIPDFFVGVGYTDDLGVLLMLINQMQSLITEEIKQKLNQTSDSNPEAAKI